MFQKNRFGLLPHNIYKNKPKWIKEINARAKTIILLDDNIVVNLCDFRLGNGFLDLIPKEQAISPQPII